MNKFTCTGYGFAKNGSKILRHYGSNGIGHSEALAEESLLKGAKLLRHYGTKKGCHSELVSESHRDKMLKQVQHDKRVMKKCAFTLSEVLIVLAVLGVVAAMTIPDLIQDYREKALITALKKTYTTLSQAVDMATAENGPPNTWDMGVKDSCSDTLKLYNILEPYLRIEKTCGTSKGCFAENYEALADGVRFRYQPATVCQYAKGVLASGVSFYTYARGTTSCSITSGCATIGVDVNGKAGPNKAGVDYFMFTISENEGLMPMGYEIGWTGYDCSYGNSSPMAGPGCTWWAIKHENMDYLHKAGKYNRY